MVFDLEFLFLILASLFTGYRSFLVENYLRLIHNKDKINFVSYFTDLNFPEHAFRAILIIPIISNREELKKERIRINIVTIITYVFIILFILQFV